MKFTLKKELKKSRQSERWLKMLRQNWKKKKKSSMLKENQEQYSTTLPMER